MKYGLSIVLVVGLTTAVNAQYSKGEKDASKHLISYIYSHEETDYLYFKSDISIPMGDNGMRFHRVVYLAG